ncbi:esterase/lipase family protein [Rhodopirellula sp. P2]|uniref:esterase/lipase family protein n=1 Tax=Rhodopirellula sp. P2 TaxID=2127060 RepID=UPI00236792D3|nr:alpha/beta hydrolase [Rhodopirellula sp. P2]WDQ19041.1 alpha/beta hydrolase [Rhodopirellula sp. P2]
MDRHTLKIANGKNHVHHDMVIATHGFLSSGQSLDPIADLLTTAGYECAVWEYPSLRGSILSHASRLVGLIQAAMARPDIRRIHFVAHSMGGIIVRAAIAQSRMETLAKNQCGRLLMLAPPNKGSWLTRLPLGPFASQFPQLVELSEKEDSLVNRLPRLQRFDVGVIAAQNDWIVSQTATHLDGQRDHAVVPTSHQRLVQHPQAIEMTLRFLERGQLHESDAHETAGPTIPFQPLSHAHDTTVTEHSASNGRRAA